MGKKQYLTEDAKWGYLLIAPTIIGLIVLNVYPFLQTLVLSFSTTHPFGYYEVSGVENYVQMFGNKEFWKATWNSIYFCILTVPLGIFLSLLTAVLLNAKIRAKAAFRAIYFLPMVVASHSHGVEMDFQRRVWHYQPDHRKQDKLADQPQAGASGLCGGGSLERRGI